MSDPWKLGVRDSGRLIVSGYRHGAEFLDEALTRGFRQMHYFVIGLGRPLEAVRSYDAGVFMDLDTKRLVYLPETIADYPMRYHERVCAAWPGWTVEPMRRIWEPDDQFRDQTVWPWDEAYVPFAGPVTEASFAELGWFDKHEYLTEEGELRSIWDDGSLSDVPDADQLEAIYLQFALEVVIALNRAQYAISNPRHWIKLARESEERTSGPGYEGLKIFYHPLFIDFAAVGGLFRDEVA